MFGERLKELRKEKNLTQTDIAKIFNVTDATVSTWEVGKAQPSFDILMELAKYFNVSTDYLLGIIEDDKPKIEKLRQTLREAGIMVGTDLSYDELNRALRIVEMMKENNN